MCKQADTDLAIADRAGVIDLARVLAEAQQQAGMLSDAEATCRTLCSTARDYPGRLNSKRTVNLRSDLTLDLARIVKAQGRLDEARQLCEDANDQDAQLVSTHLHSRSGGTCEGLQIHQRLCIWIHLCICARKMGSSAAVPGAERVQLYLP